MSALNDELGREEWIRRTGLPLTLSDTAAKLRWLRETDPAAAERTAAVAVVHDWLTWRLRGHGAGSGGIEQLIDRPVGGQRHRLLVRRDRRVLHGSVRARLR